MIPEIVWPYVDKVASFTGWRLVAKVTTGGEQVQDEIPALRYGHHTDLYGMVKHYFQTTEAPFIVYRCRADGSYVFQLNRDAVVVDEVIHRIDSFVHTVMGLCPTRINSLTGDNAYDLVILDSHAKLKAEGTFIKNSEKFAVSLFTIPAIPH